MDPREAAALLDEIAEDCCSSFEMESEFRKRAESPGDPVVKTVAAALQYGLSESDEPRRETYGPFVPMLETGDAVIPPYTSDLDRDVLAMWERLVELVESPIVGARLHDLLWVTRFGNSPHEHARAAIDRYIAAAELARCDGLEPFSFLDRALDLSREINDPQVAERVGPIAAEELVAEYGRHEADPRPGVVIRLLTLLVDLPEASHPSDLRARLDQAHVLFTGGYPDNRVALFQLQEKLAKRDPKEVARLQRAIVEIWIWWAEQQERALVRQDALSRALALANNTEAAADMRDDIRRRLEEIDPDDLHTSSIEATIDVPTEEIEKFIGYIVGHDGIGPALERFGKWWPPTGDPEATAAAAEEQMQRFTLLSLIPVVVSNAEGHPIQRIETPEEKRKWFRAKHEMWMGRTNAIVAHMVLKRIGEVYAPDQEDLRALFQTDFISSHQAEVFTRAYEHHWADRFDEAAHIALPRVEAVLRQILVASGGVAYKEPRAGRPGGVKPLGEVLQDLSQFLPDQWLHTLRTLLTDRLTLNLRNDYLHGLVTHAPDAQALQQDAVLVLWIAAHLRLLRVQPSTDSPAEDD